MIDVILHQELTSNASNHRIEEIYRKEYVT